MQWIENSIKDGLIKYYEFEEFENTNKIYDSRFVKVYSAKYKSYRVAIKTLHCDSYEYASDEIVNEIQLYREMSYHKNIAMLHGVTKEGAGKTFSLVLEYANNVEMFEYLRNSCNLKDCLNITVQIARLLLCLHNEDIFGIDIRSNLLLDNNKNIKLSSLGLSKRIAKADQSKNQDIIDFGYVLNEIKSIHSNEELDRLFKVWMKSNSIKECINILEIILSNKAREIENNKIEIVKTIRGKNRQRQKQSVASRVKDRYREKQSIALRVKKRKRKAKITKTENLTKFTFDK